MLSVLTLLSCHRFRRNYQVHYARVPVDTLAHNDSAKNVVRMGGEDGVDPADWDESPLFEDVSFDGQVDDPAAARREYRKYMSGE